MVTDTYVNKIKFSEEKLVGNEKSSKRILLLIYRKYIGYYITKKKEYLSEALNLAIEYFNKTNSNMDFYFTIIFLYCEIEEFKLAKDLFSSLKKFKNYFKNNEQLNYFGYNFLESYYKIKNSNNFNKNKKILSKFENYFESIEESFVKNKGFIYLGLIQLLCGNIQEAQKSFENAFVYKNNQVLLNLFLYTVYETEIEVTNKNMFKEFLRWSIFQNINIKDIILLKSEFINNEIDLDLKTLENIYEEYKFDFILIKICDKLKTNKDSSEKALKYYKLFDKNSYINLDNIDFYIKLSSINNSKSISLNTLQLYLDNTNPNDKVLEYVYYLLVTYKKYNDLLNSNKERIIQFAVLNLERNEKSVYLSSIYVFFLEFYKAYTIDEKFGKQAKSTIQNQLFSYDAEVEDENITSIWIIESEKKDLSSFGFNKKKVSFTASSSNFRYICLSDKEKEVVNPSIKIRKRVINFGTDLLEQLYFNGGRNNDLLITLSRIYMKKNVVEEKYLAILKDTLKIENLSFDFKLKLNGVIGKILDKQGLFKEAFSFYKNIDIGYISKKNADSILNVYVKTKNFDKALDLIIEKNDFISDVSLFDAVREIIKIEKYQSDVSETCVKLMNNSWYDKEILNVVLKYYKGSILEWQSLNKVLKNLAVDTNAIEEKILTNALFIKKFDLEIENVFINFYSKNENENLIEMVIYFIIYKILIDNITIQNETIKILENEYLKSENEILCYALSSVYTTGNVKNEKLISKSISLQQKNEILFPVFKTIKDKNLTTAYIDENKPFIYKTFPNRKVFLYYKFKIEDDFEKKQMKYLNFGLYMSTIVNFYNEEIIYYFSEVLERSSIDTKEDIIKNDKLIEYNGDYLYYKINNALVYEKTLQYDKVLEIIENEVMETKKIKGKLL